MAVKMQAEHEGELNIVLVEVQGASPEDVERFALQKKWLGTSVIWTTERPFRTGSRGIPNCALLSADGEVVLKGHPMALHKQIEEHIAASKRARTRAPDDLPRQLSGAWKSYARGKLGAAIQDATRVVERASGDDAPAVAAAAEDLVARAVADAEARLSRVDRMIEEGRYHAATDLAKDLTKLLRGSDLVARTHQRLDRLESDELEVEIKAEKSLAKLERVLYAKGPDDGTTRRLAKFARKYPNTKAGARASHLESLLR